MYKLLPSQVVQIAIATAFIVVGYNACSKVKFSTEGGGARAQINSSLAITVNNNDTFTNAYNVRVQLLNPSASEVYLTNDPTCATGGTWQPFEAEKPWVLGEGNIETKVYAKFRHKNGVAESLCVNDAIIHDDKPPVIDVTQKPKAFINVTTTEIKFQVNDELSGVKSVQCKNENPAAPTACTNSIVRTGMTEGPRRSEIVATDNAGNVSAPVPVDWIVDLTPPVVTINMQPAATTSSRSAIVTFTATDALSGIDRSECRLDAAPFSPCVDKVEASNLADGRHEVTIRAYDRAGNVSPDAKATWVIDQTVPYVTITKYPPALSGSRDATFEFIGKDGTADITVFECKMDGGSYALCNSPKNYTNLTEGSHTFYVRGYDSSGNVSAPASYTWTIDATAPVVTITQGPDKRTKERTATFAFIATDAGSGVAVIECSLDNSAYTPCTSAHTYSNNLAEGPHKFMVRAKDRAGNISMPAIYEWVIDLTPPIVKIVVAPPAFTNNQTANFTFQATDPNGGGIKGLECRRENEPDYTPCQYMTSYSNVPEGSHSILVRAIDTVGNIGPAVGHNWVVDLTPPVILFTRVPIEETSFVDEVRIDYRVTDALSGVDRIACTYNGAAVACTFTNDFGTVTLPPANTERSHVFTLTAYDRAGNQATSEVKWKTVRVVQYPSASELATITFEDNYPNPGDADYNDFTADFKIVEKVNTSGNIEQISVDFYPVAKGAGFEHALLFVMDGIKDPPTNLTQSTPKLFNGPASIRITYFRPDGSVESQSISADTQKDITVFAKTSALFPITPGDPVNTGSESSRVDALRSARLEFFLQDPTQNPLGTRRAVNLQQYRMVLKVQNTEIKKVMDIDLIDVNADAVDSNNYPYGFIIPTSWRYPKEQIHIKNVYPKFIDYRDYLLARRSNPNLQLSTEVKLWYEYLATGQQANVFQR